MDNTSLLNTPILWVNKYIQHKMSDLGFDTIPFFPSTPSTINDITQYFPEGGVMSTWDRMIRMNKKTFPHIKTEQVLYYFYATEENSVTNMVKITESILRLLDRADESAAEINNWAMNRSINMARPNEPTDTLDNMFYFHTFKVYQLEETRDIIDFGTARTYGGNKFIVEFEYHQDTDLTNSEWQPEPKAAIKTII